MIRRRGKTGGTTGSNQYGPKGVAKDRQAADRLSAITGSYATLKAQASADLRPVPSIPLAAYDEDSFEDTSATSGPGSFSFRRGDLSCRVSPDDDHPRSVFWSVADDDGSVLYGYEQGTDDAYDSARAAVARHPRTRWDRAHAELSAQLGTAPEVEVADGGGGRLTVTVTAGTGRVSAVRIFDDVDVLQEDGAAVTDEALHRSMLSLFAAARDMTAAAQQRAVHEHIFGS